MKAPLSAGHDAHFSDVPPGLYLVLVTIDGDNRAWGRALVEEDGHETISLLVR
jgi:hypothetical protein